MLPIQVVQLYVIEKVFASTIVNEKIRLNLRNVTQKSLQQ